MKIKNVEAAHITMITTLINSGEVKDLTAAPEEIWEEVLKKDVLIPVLVSRIPQAVIAYGFISHELYGCHMTEDNKQHFSEITIVDTF